MLDENFISDKREFRQLNKKIVSIALVLSIIVASSVFWGLKLTGISMAGDALCGIEEHSHDEECYVDSLICESDENEEHQHIEACYEQILACETEEHIHTTVCYSDTTADVESESIWKGSFIDEVLTDDLRSNLMIIVLSQFGYTESKNNFDVDENGSRMGYTRYGDWYGNKYCAWSSVFVSFCLNYAGISADDAPYSDSPAEMLQLWSEKDLFVNDEYYAPLFGDLVFLDNNNDGICDAVGIVNDVGYQQGICAIQGDSNNTVEEINYVWNDSAVMGYGVLNAAIHDDISEYTVSPMADTGTISVYQVNKYSAIRNLIAYGGSSSSLNLGMSFTYWTAYVIESGSNGLYVSAISPSQVSKLNLAANTLDGFVVFTQESFPDISVGDYVTVSPANFYKSTTGSSTTPYGTLTFSTTPAATYEGTKKPDKDNSNKLTTVQAADTMDLIEVNLYDYGLNCNDLWKSDNKYPGFQQGGGTASATSLSRWNMNFGDNITSEIFSGATSVTNQGGDINKTNADNSASRPISGAISNKLIDGYPALNDGTSLAYLFSDNIYATKQNKQNINGLFQYDKKTSSYYYNCRENHAQFNSDNDTFTLYEQTITPNFIMYPFGNFLPLNDIVKESTQTPLIDRTYFNTVSQSALYKYSAEKLPSEYSKLNKVLDQYIYSMDRAYGAGNWDYDECLQKYFELSRIPLPDDLSYLNNLYNIDYDEESDFFFGMDMHLDFIQPKNGLTGENGNYPMVFDFAGDDDVWIFVDGQLFLDLSGIHRHVGGVIDFEKGEVRYYDFNPETSETDLLVDTVTFAEILGSSKDLNEKGAFKDYSTHSFDFYYMERGSGSGICKMEFNLPTLQRNTISVAKDLTSDTDLSEVLGDPDFYFQIYKEGGNEVLIGSGVTYDIYSTSSNEHIGTAVTGADGMFSIKAGQRAVFKDIPENAGSYFVRELLDRSIFEQYGTVNIDGSSTTLDHYTNVTVGEDSFKGIDSAVKDISDGSTYFTFSNDVDGFKFGALEISKILQDYSAEHTLTEFTFLVELDDTPLPAGTSYTIIHSDESQEILKVTDTGIIKLKHGERIILNNILAGSKFSVKEIGLSADEYSIIYESANTKLDCLTDDNGIPYVTGLIAAESAMGIKVTNDKNGTKLGIPVTKSVTNPDGNEYKFTFDLNELVSAANSDFKPGGVHLQSKVTIISGSSDFIFTINYPSDTHDGKHYYMITEAFDDSLDKKVEFDDSYYIAEVTTQLVDGTVRAELTGLWKNGLVDNVENIEFENNIMRSLSISKKVEGYVKGDSAFRFDITAKIGDTPVNGKFKCFGTAEDEIQIVNGHATVYISDGETLQIIGLPSNMSWTVEEITHNGFYTSCAVGNNEPTEGTSLSGNLDASVTINFTNFSGNVLPATGSYNWLFYALGGLLLIAVPLVYGCILGRKRERRAD